jgi:primosomal protein N' (replication factor Y)
VPVPVDRLFDYEVPEDLAREAEVGRRVRAPFGGRRLTGVIVELGAERAAAARPAPARGDPRPRRSCRCSALVEGRGALTPVGIALAARPPGPARAEAASR